MPLRTEHCINLEVVKELVSLGVREPRPGTDPPGRLAVHGCALGRDR